MLIEHDVHALSEQTMNIGVSQVDLYEACLCNYTTSAVNGVAVKIN